MEEKLPFYGKTFVVTGTTEKPREEIVNRIRELGGKVTISISGVTSYLIAGEEPGPSKMKKALEKRVKILSELEFFEITKDYIVQPMCISQGKEEKGNRMWIDKHKPESLSQMKGNFQAISQVKKHFLALSRTPLLITGGVGVGKTLSVYLAAKELGVTLIEYNGADCRNKAEIAKLSIFSTQMTISSSNHIQRNKVLLLEDIDEIGGSDRGGLPEIISMFKSTKIPIILTATDKTNPKLKSILSYCTVVTFSKVDSRTLTNVFKEIVKKEEINISDNTLMRIAAVCGGDIRYGINTLQCLCKKKTIASEDILSIGKTFTSQGIFEKSKDLFLPSNSPAKKISAWFSDPLLSLLMVFENYLEGSIHQIAKNSNDLSKAENLTISSLYNGETRLFQLAAYYTTVKPYLRLTSKINFSKYLGFSSSYESKKKKYLRALSHMETAGVFGGWSILYFMCSIALILSDRDIPVQQKNQIISDLKIDKEDYQAILDTIKATKIKGEKLVFQTSWE
ncbi:replication factor C subunit 1 [Nematocida sp. LUAm3]|nr:replication factor C subunit 1 [Nematocida sp. LUAm3]KAI5174040.1 replication factor C subunit 1 [Nematocida sp. LUAm2]KAI5177217.1 replication factor C subunit 1 [Nematocida sp. LUAm1]